MFVHKKQFRLINYCAHNQVIIVLKMVLLATVLSCVFLSFTNAQNGNAVLKVVEGEKSAYCVGDIISIRIMAILPSETCDDGIGKTKLFLSGLELMDEMNWQKNSRTQWSKTVKVKVVNNKKGMSKITLFREADKGSFFSQLKIRIDDTCSK